MQFCFPPAFPSAVHGCQCLGQQGQPLCGLSYAPIRFGQQGKIIRSVLPLPVAWWAAGPAHLRRPFCPLSLGTERPTPQDGRLRQVLCKPLLGRERHQGLCPLYVACCSQRN